MRFATISIVRSLLAPVPLADRSGHDVDVAGPTPCDRCRTQAVTNPATSHPRARSNAGIDARVAWHLLVPMSATNKAVAGGEGDDRSACRTTRVRRPRGNEVRRAAKAGLRPLSGTRLGRNSSSASIWQRSRLRPTRGRSCWSSTGEDIAGAVDALARPIRAALELAGTGDRVT